MNRSPFAHRAGEIRSLFGAGLQQPKWKLGSNEFYGRFRLADLAAGKLEPPSGESLDWQLSLEIKGPKNYPILKIEKNEWVLGIEEYDLRWDGKVLSIWVAKGEPVLQMSVETSEAICVSRLHAQNSFERLDIDRGVLTMNPISHGKLALSVREQTVENSGVTKAVRSLTVDGDNRLNGLQFLPQVVKSRILIEDLRIRNCPNAILVSKGSSYIVNKVTFESCGAAFAYENYDGSTSTDTPDWSTTKRSKVSSKRRPISRPTAVFTL